MKETAPQEGVGQFLLVVGGDDDDGSGARRHRLAGLVDEEFHPVEFLQQVVRKLDVGLVDLVDQKDRLAFGLEGLPELAALDVVGDIVHARLAQLAVAQTADGVVFVKPLLGAGRGLDVPLDDRQAQRRGHLPRKLGLAGAGLALHQKRPLQRDRRVHGDGQVLGRDIALGAFEAHLRVPSGSACSTSDLGGAARRVQHPAEGRRARQSNFIARVPDFPRPADLAADNQGTERTRRVTTPPWSCNRAAEAGGDLMPDQILHAGSGEGSTMKAEVFLPEDYRPAEDEPFMNERQLEYFRRKLLSWKHDLLEESRSTVETLQDGTRNIPDVADRASEETDRALELRTARPPAQANRQDRQRAAPDRRG